MEVTAAAAKPTLRVASICGSLCKDSWHRGLLRAAAEVSEESIPGLRVEHVDISALPMLNTDLETDDGNGFSLPPSRPSATRSARPTASSSPRPSPLKNALDWASRGSNCWGDRTAAIVSAGGDFGGGRSSYHLRQVGVYLDLHFINKPELFVKGFHPSLTTRET
ncbi:hypothetical protein E2562_038770 [Oryza meyeriana var. granulata]|uniref:NAD(P)H dehydrogenase (quinone) n=1 Tax=Oryza meyeriana var. granulata TaxID=110450 RepID=A0A6G1CWS7_9ORYZ|nr:hypothetical protein E2562_038770 [Oryza meyeriana var. granulata]